MDMSSQQYVKTGICEKYQTLLEECERALASWNERREKVSQSRLVRKDAGDELLRLQANYARAYTMLQNHLHQCTFCELVRRLEGRGESENSSDAVFDDARYH
jgi:response regulator of citrate/malate metabolism